MENSDKVSQRMALFIADGAEILARLDKLNQKLSQKLTTILDEPVEKLSSEQRFNQLKHSSTNRKYRIQTVSIIWPAPNNPESCQDKSDKKAPPA